MIATTVSMQLKAAELNHSPTMRGRHSLGHGFDLPVCILLSTRGLPQNCPFWVVLSSHIVDHHHRWRSTFATVFAFQMFSSWAASLWRGCVAGGSKMGTNLPNWFIIDHQNVLFILLFQHLYRISYFHFLASHALEVMGVTQWLNDDGEWRYLLETWQMWLWWVRVLTTTMITTTIKVICP